MTHTICTEDLTPTTTETRLNVPKEIKTRKRAVSCHSWFEGPFNTVRGETALWVAVITQAMMDALNRSRHPEQIYHKQAAMQWLTGNSKEFRLVCLFAGMDPDYVRRKAKRALVSPTAWRAAPGKGHRYLERKAYRQRNKKEPLAKESERAAKDSFPPQATATVIAGPWH